MSNDLYAQIRKQLGADNPDIRSMWKKIYHKLLPRIYPRRTHFIYELLQNAEDACERARQIGQETKFKVKFDLQSDSLKIFHNGIPFNENDVIGISKFLEGTKENDITQIGKFGIGFKSVFNYSDSPEIYSGNKSFHFVDGYPYSAEPIKEKEPDETVIVLPLGTETINKEKAYEDIEKELLNLSSNVLLFLRNISEISVNTNKRKKRINKETIFETKFKQVSLSYFDGNAQRPSEKWLVFDSSPNIQESLGLKVAYRLENQKIAPVEAAKLFAYFPTAIDTHLKFLIQGPYHTSPARDNINDDDYNYRLIEKTAILICDTILQMKELRLLDVDFLCVLPIETDAFIYGENIFRPIYEQVKEKFSEEELLPTDQVGFSTKNDALIARGQDLRKLLSPDKLEQLFGKKNAKWLNPKITQDNTPMLWNYLTEVLLIEVVEPEDIVREVNEAFIRKQSDQWIVSFYGFFSDKQIRERLRSKQIIRLEDDSIVKPQDAFGGPNAYLPSSDSNLRKLFPNSVKKEIANDKRARDFLKALNIEEPDVVSVVTKFILPKYRNSDEMISEEENLKHLELILQALNYCPGTKISNLLHDLIKTPFLIATDFSKSNQKTNYLTPQSIHLGNEYTGKTELEIYFDGNKEVRFLDKRYLKILNTQQTVDQLRRTGLKSDIQIIRRESGEFYSGSNIEGLEYALSHINIEKSRIIWELAKRNRNNISSSQEIYVNGYSYPPKRYIQFSIMGKALVESKWLPDNNAIFHKPSEMMLKDLPESFEKESLEAKDLAQKLQLKPEPNIQLRELIGKAPEEMKPKLNRAMTLLEMFMNASPEQEQLIIESTRKAMTPIEEVEEKGKGVDFTNQVTPTPAEILEKFEQALEQGRVGDQQPEDKSWRAVTPEQEEEMRKHEREILEKMPKTFKTEYQITRQIKTEKGEAVYKSYLRSLYDGHCQICNTKLELGGGKPSWFDVYHLIEKRDQCGDWSWKEFNTLSVCPNCFALMKKGVPRQMRAIIDKAENVRRGEEAPEEVRERNGLYYVVNVNIAGQSKRLFYHPYHMAKVATFLEYIRDHLE